MKYYKVNPKSDQIRVHKNNSFLIANELKTEKELIKLAITNLDFIINNFTVIEISKNRTYFLFGARFEN